MDKKGLQALANELQDGEFVTISSNTSLEDELRALIAGDKEYADITASEKAEHPCRALSFSITRLRRINFPESKVRFTYLQTAVPNVFRVMVKSRENAN